MPGALVAIFCVEAGAVEELTADDVVRLVSAQDPEISAAEDRVSLAEAEGELASLYPNPSMSFAQEAVFPDATAFESENFLMLAVPVDLSTRRQTRTLLARSAAAAARARLFRERSQDTARALTLFYELLFEREQEALESAALERLERAAFVVRRRREEGSVSGYDQTRIEVEVELFKSVLRQTRSRLERLHSELLLLLGKDGGDVRFVGTLTPDASLKTLQAPASPLMEGDDDDATRARPPSLSAMAESTALAKEAEGISRWSFLPAVSISVGPRILTSAAELHPGYAAGLAVELPIFSQSKALEREASASAQLAFHSEQTKLRTARLKMLRARVRLETAQAEAAALEAVLEERMEKLERSVESGYREGELSLMELIDARRARLLLERRKLEQALEIKKAEVALREAQGVFQAEDLAPPEIAQRAAHAGERP